MIEMHWSSFTGHQDRSVANQNTPRKRPRNLDCLVVLCFVPMQNENIRGSELVL